MKVLPRRARKSPLLGFLSSRRSYPEHPRKIQLVQTHASWVVLTDQFVYKVKKPVDFGFLDFTTLERRRHFCEREVELNRRLCPDVYIGVIPICRKGTRLRFEGDGVVVEYAVQMRRLAERYFLLKLLKKGRPAKKQIDRVIATLQPFYMQPCQMRALVKWGRVAKLRESTAENFRQTRAFLGSTISHSAGEAIHRYTNQFYREHGALFRKRVHEGRIRDCHGDLHLEHIHMAPDRVSIYDCIEFNDRFRRIDVANDLAFLTMDLDFHGRSDLGAYLANRMAKELCDPGMLRVLDFYKCYRAYVRGKVESFQSTAPGVSGRKQAASRELAQQYFRLALQYAVSGSKPMILIVMGQVGTGKSSLARALADELGWKIFSSDRLRKQLAGLSLRIRGSAAVRASLYSRRMSDRTYAALWRSAKTELRRGHSAILDATFASRTRREEVRAKLRKAPVDYCFIEACAPSAAVRSRLAAREHSTNEISDARLEDYPGLKRAYEAPEELDPKHFLAVQTTGAVEKALNAALQALACRRASILE